MLLWSGILKEWICDRTTIVFHFYTNERTTGLKRYAKIWTRHRQTAEKIWFANNQWAVVTCKQVRNHAIFFFLNVSEGKLKNSIGIQATSPEQENIEYTEYLNKSNLHKKMYIKKHYAIYIAKYLSEYIFIRDLVHF